MKRLALVAIALSLAASASAEQFYKWKDENGTWHYTTEPPKEGQSQPILVNATGHTVQPEGEGAATAAAAPAADGQPVAKPGDPVVANADTVKPLSEAAKAKAANCERARTNVATLESYNNVTVQRDGADVKLSEDEHAAELKRARQQVETFCN